MLYTNLYEPQIKIIPILCNCSANSMLHLRDYSKRSHSKEWQTLDNACIRVSMERVDEKKVVWYFQPSRCAEMTACELFDTSHWKQNSLCKLQACYVFFPCHMHKEALWIRGGTILRVLEDVSPMEAWRLYMSTLFKIMSWAVINNSKWGGLYFLINISDRNICKCILDWQRIIIVSKLPCALWLSDTGKYL